MYLKENSLSDPGYNDPEVGGDAHWWDPVRSSRKPPCTKDIQTKREVQLEDSTH